MSEDTLHFELVRSERRTLLLKVLEDGRVQVRAPRRLARRQVEAFVKERRDWIHEKQREMARRPRPRWRHGDSCQHLGERRVLALDTGRRQVRLRDDVIHVRLPNPDDEAGVRHAVEEWWRGLARERFRESIERQFPWFRERGHSLPVLRVKRMRSRWGSLSSRGYINLNLALMQYPPAVIDYIVMHELCHLEYMHHGPAFHRLMDQRMPDWRARKALL